MKEMLRLSILSVFVLALGGCMEKKDAVSPVDQQGQVQGVPNDDGSAPVEPTPLSE